MPPPKAGHMHLVKGFLDSPTESLPSGVIPLLSWKPFQDLMSKQAISIAEVKTLTSEQGKALKKYPDVFKFIEKGEITLTKLVTLPLYLFCNDSMFNLIKNEILTLTFLGTLNSKQQLALMSTFVHRLMECRELTSEQLSSCTDAALSALQSPLVQTLIGNGGISIEKVLKISDTASKAFCSHYCNVFCLFNDELLNVAQMLDLTFEIVRTLENRFVYTAIVSKKILVSELFSLRPSVHHALRDPVLCGQLIIMGKLTIGILNSLTDSVLSMLISFNFEFLLLQCEFTIADLMELITSAKQPTINLFTSHECFAFQLLYHKFYSLNDFFNLTHIASQFLIDVNLRKFFLNLNNSLPRKDRYQRILRLTERDVGELITKGQSIKSLLALYSLRNESLARHFIIVKEMPDFETAEASQIWLNMLMSGGGDQNVVGVLIDVLKRIISVFDMKTKAGDKHYTAYFWAAHYGLTNVIQELMKKDTIDSKQSNTMIHIAAERGHWQLFEYLFRLNPNTAHTVLRQTENGWTALYHAIYNDSSEEWISVLLENGADSNTPVANGETPAGLAFKKHARFNAFYIIYMCLRPYYYPDDLSPNVESWTSEQRSVYYSSLQHLIIVEDFVKLLQAIDTEGLIRSDYNPQLVLPKTAHSTFYKTCVDSLLQLDPALRLIALKSFNEKLLELKRMSSRPACYLSIPALERERSCSL